MGGEGGDSLRWGKHTERAAEGTQGWSGGGFGQVWAMSLAGTSCCYINGSNYSD